MRAFRRLQDAGRVEVITSTATHAFFPLMDRNWADIRAQVHVAADLYERHFGRRPRGMWLGECGYVPGVDELLREAAIRYFFVDTHGILFADAARVYGVYAPLYCPSGVAAFGRDTESSEQVWSAKEGYPGDRTTATSIATSASTCRSTTSSRTSTPKGTASTRASSTTPSPTTSCTTSGSTIRTSRAARRASTPRTSAATARSRSQQLRGAHGPPADHRQPVRRRALRPLVVRGAACSSATCSGSCTSTRTRSRRSRRASTWIATPPTSSRPPARRRGAKGYNEYWLNETNAWIYRHLHVAGERMVELARTPPRAADR